MSEGEDYLRILVIKGEEVVNLLQKAKSRPLEASVDIPGEVKSIVRGVLNSIKSAPANAGFAKDSVEKLSKGIEATLLEFIKHDSDNKSVYDEVMNEVVEFRHREQVVVAAPSLDPQVSNNAHHATSPDDDDNDLIDSAVKKLTGKDRQLLSCFLLFPEEAEIRKREIIHCWLGMDLPNSLDGERLLAKLVALGLVERPILNKKLLNRYVMPVSVRSKLLEQYDTLSHQIKSDKSWSTLFRNDNVNDNNNNDNNNDNDNGNDNELDQQPLKTAKLKNPRKKQPLLGRAVTMLGDVTSADGKNADAKAVVNISQDMLNAARFKTMSKMTKLKVLHLGYWEWQQDSERYIVVEDIEAFKHLGNLRKLGFLSLEGVSGVVKLHNSVYDHVKLKVLDLRGCNNLEQIPSGIKSLRSLTHLDLSGCYLLDHVPQGITYLANLQVLKGFVINTQQHLDAEKKGKDKDKSKGKGKEKHIPSSSPCLFPELSNLKLLRKLTILSRRMDFPTRQDFQTFGEMKSLNRLRIVWVGNSESTNHTTAAYPFEIFPAELTKLELQAAPEKTVTRLLRVISQDKGNCCLEKLYIRGGGLRELEESVYAQSKVVRLRYLPQLKNQWDDFKKMFPNLGRLEVQGCPNLISFPCDHNGVWEKRY